MAFFMLTKIHPELDKVVAEKKHQIPVATAQQYPTVSISQCHTLQYIKIIHCQAGTNFQECGM